MTFIWPDSEVSASLKVRFPSGMSKIPAEASDSETLAVLSTVRIPLVLNE